MKWRRKSNIEPCHVKAPCSFEILRVWRTIEKANKIRCNILTQSIHRTDFLLIDIPKIHAKQIEKLEQNCFPVIIIIVCALRGLCSYPCFLRLKVKKNARRFSI